MRASQFAYRVNILQWICVGLRAKLSLPNVRPFYQLQAPIYYNDLVDNDSYNLSPIQQSQLQLLLQDFRQLFKEPNTLPLRRRYDHQISLVNDKPFCLKAYRYEELRKKGLRGRLKLSEPQFYQRKWQSICFYIGVNEEKRRILEMY